MLSCSAPGSRGRYFDPSRAPARHGEADLRLYDFHESGNGYKVRLLVSHLGLEHERIELDILYYLAQGTSFWPEDVYTQAQVLSWMNFEQYSHEPFIATVRFWTFAGQLDEHADELPGRRERGEAALDVMEARLADHPFLVDDRYSPQKILLFVLLRIQL